MQYPHALTVAAVLAPVVLGAPNRTEESGSLIKITRFENGTTFNDTRSNSDEISINLYNAHNSTICAFPQIGGFVKEAGRHGIKLPKGELAQLTGIEPLMEISSRIHIRHGCNDTCQDCIGIDEEARLAHTDDPESVLFGQSLSPIVFTLYEFIWQKGVNGLRLYDDISNGMSYPLKNADRS